MMFLAAQDQDGFIACATNENLARMANLTLTETIEALEVLMAPDKNSTNPDNDGRRIERVPGGFLVLNSKHYRELKNREMEREMNRIRAANYRGRKKRHENRDGARESVLPTVSKRSQKIPATTFTPEFDQFWAAYPKKVAKSDAFAAWVKIGITNGTLELILKALAWQTVQSDWTKEQGKYIPHPTTYLNRGSWMDEQTTQKTQLKGLEEGFGFFKGGQG